jgi:hypothetical protein
VSKSKKVLLIILLLVLGLYYLWPQIGGLNILSLKEQEVHGYLKEILPAVRSTLQKFKQLDEDPVNATFPAELGNLSDEILTINVKYWEIGSRSQTFVQMLINKVRGSKDQETSFLAHWRGPEKDAEALNDMRMDTRTLIYRAWVIKESSIKLAQGMQNMLAGWESAGKNSTLEATALVETCWRSLGDVDQVYRRWKGNYRPPFSFSS